MSVVMLSVGVRSVRWDVASISICQDDISKKV